MIGTTKGKPVNIVVLTVSDTRTNENDKSGDTLAKRLTEAGHHLVEKRIVKDELSLLKDVLKEWINSSEVDVIIATGGTGVTGRDVTPEAFESLYEKAIPGFGELFRWLSYRISRLPPYNLGRLQVLRMEHFYLPYPVPPARVKMRGT